MKPKTTDELVRALEEACSLRDLSRYFHGEGPDGRPLYTGARFDVLDGGGARSEVRDKITPSDLLAVACLEVVVPTPVCLDLVEGPLGEQVTALLSEIPADMQMGDTNADKHIKDKSPADKAWQLLDQEVGVGWVTAGKLLARKRPALIPVWDSVVRCAFGGPKANQWLWLNEHLRHARLRESLDRLHHDAELTDRVSHLRVLDVVLWMRHHDQHRRSGCPGLEVTSGLKA